MNQTPEKSVAPLMEALCTEDGDPWGVYAYGHIDPRAVTLNMLNRALQLVDLRTLKRKPQIEHLWMRMDEEAGGDFPWFWCEATTKGAVAVTGVRFRSVQP